MSFIRIPVNLETGFVFLSLVPSCRLIQLVHLVPLHTKWFCTMEEVIWNSSSCPRLCVHKAYNFLETFMWARPGQLVLFIPTSPSCSELFHRSFIERFSNDSLPITTWANAAVNQSEFLSFIYNSSCSKCGKNRTYKVRLLLVIGWKTGARFLSQSRSVATTIALSLSKGNWKLF